MRAASVVIISSELLFLQWSYDEFISIGPNLKAPTAANEFIIAMKKNTKKTDTMRFSTEHRADLLTEALRFRHLFAEKNVGPVKVYSLCCKHYQITRHNSITFYIYFIPFVFTILK